MELTMLGTGSALVTECYNTCFVLQEDQQYFMVDGGGGSTILHQLKHAGINWKDIKTIFVTHKHIDHITGIIWMLRMICQHMRQGEYEGEATVYAHEELIELLKNLAVKLLQKKDVAFIGKRLHLIPVADDESVSILSKKVTFFDIQSTKAKQFGFCMELGNGEKLTCCGDEPYKNSLQRTAHGYCMKHFVWRAKQIFFIRMKSIIPQWQMQANWQKNCM